MSQIDSALPMNELFMEQVEIDADITLNIGGRYSAKTFSVVQKNTSRCATRKNYRIAVFRKTYASIKESIYSEYLNIPKLYGLNDFSNTAPKGRVSPLHIDYPTGSEIIFRGADDPDKIKGLANAHAGHMEEASEFDESDFDTIIMSLRGKGYPFRLDLTTNPVPTMPGSPHWLQKRFRIDECKLNENYVYFDETLGSKICILKSNYKANIFIKQRHIDILEGYKETNPGLYLMWTLGDFATVEGVILTKWRVVSEVPDNRMFIGYGLDFGFSSDPAACTKVWIDRKERVIWAELIMYNTNFTNHMIGLHLRDNGVKPLDKVVFDSAEPKSGEELSKMGFRGVEGAKKRSNYKTEMAQYLQGYEIRVIKNSYSDKARNELSTWAWQKDKNGSFMPKPTDGNDHFIDSMIMLLHNALAAHGKGKILTQHF